MQQRRLDRAALKGVELEYEVLGIGDPVVLIFSRMSNDAVITSPSRDFEISSGAQMQLLVRANSSK